MTDLASAAAQKRALTRAFFRKGVTLAVLSGMFYGLYSAFLAYAMSQGAWADWYGPNTAGLTAFTIVYLLGALGSGVNDLMSAVWALALAAAKGKLGDVGRCLRSRPGLVMMACAVIGGPVASAAYVVALQLGGSLVIPVTALCPAIGAILGRVLFRQPLNARMAAGILVCLAATLMVGGVSLGDAAPAGAFLGCLIAFVAALGWGVEGCVAGFGTTLIDYDIGITIRQLTSGVVNLGLLIPLLALLAGQLTLAPELVAAAFTTAPGPLLFLVSGGFALFAYSLWYKGNSMCGAALGMACNGAYSFWGPFFCWLVLGAGFGWTGWALPPLAWAGAAVMVLGILLVAVNPLTLFRPHAGEA